MLVITQIHQRYIQFGLKITIVSVFRASRSIQDGEKLGQKCEFHI